MALSREHYIGASFLASTPWGDCQSPLSVTQCVSFSPGSPWNKIACRYLMVFISPWPALGGGGGAPSQEEGGWGRESRTKANKQKGSLFHILIVETILGGGSLILIFYLYMIRVRKNNTK